MYSEFLNFWLQRSNKKTYCNLPSHFLWVWPRSKLQTTLPHKDTFISEPCLCPCLKRRSVDFLNRRLFTRAPSDPHSKYSTYIYLTNKDQNIFWLNESLWTECASTIVLRGTLDNRSWLFHVAKQIGWPGIARERWSGARRFGWLWWPKTGHWSTSTGWPVPTCNHIAQRRILCAANYFGAMCLTDNSVTILTAQERSSTFKLLGPEPAFGRLGLGGIVGRVQFSWVHFSRLASRLRRSARRGQIVRQKTYKNWWRPTPGLVTPFLRFCF